MAGKQDRAVGAVSLALAGFLVVAAIASFASASDGGPLAGLSNMTSIVIFILALVAAIPGFVLLFSRGAV